MKYPLVATEEGVFAYMQEQMEGMADLSSYVRQNFALLRVHAEKLARFHYVRDEVEEVPLGLIYDALAMTGEIDNKETARLVELEQKARAMLQAPLKSASLEKEEESDNPVSWLEGLKEDFSAQLLAGAAQKVVKDGNLQAMGKIGATLGGPILMPYVEWFLRRSADLGIRRLYFIARDGYILKLMADVLIKELGLDIRTHYIHGSRRAWRMPSYRGIKGELRGLVGWSHTQHIRSAEDLADVLQMPVEKLHPYLIGEFAEKGHTLTFGELTACVVELEKSDEFRNLLRGILAPRRRLAVEYLQQEIDTSDDNFAFVELGGGGFTQICLARIMEKSYQGPIRTFFYKMDRVRVPDKECIFYDFFPSKLKNDLTVEMVCRAPEGQTEGYYREGERIKPLKKEGEAELYKARGYEDYIRGIEAFAKAYAEVVEKFNPEPSLKTSMACMEFISRQENNEILEFFAGLPNRVTGREELAPEFAPALTKQIVQDVFFRHIGANVWSYYPGTDFNMSVRRSSPYIQRKVAKYEKMAGKIRERWLRLFPGQKLTGGFFYGVCGGYGLRGCPYSMLGKKVVLYGAGTRGRRWYKDLSADKAIEVVQWLDKDYLNLKDELPVTGDMDSLGQVPFDWVMIDFANQKLLESVIEELQQRGVAKEKIYYPARISEWISGWINYLHV